MSTIDTYRLTRLCAAFLLQVAVPDQTAAQVVNLRLGAGLSSAEGPSAAALFAVEGRLGPVIMIRVEGRGVGPGDIGLVSAGLALGIGARREKQFRPYALASLAAALDLREGDEGTLGGLVLGADFFRRFGPFVEARYDHLWQDLSPRYFDLPTDHFSLLVGLRIGLF